MINHCLHNGCKFTNNLYINKRTRNSVSALNKKSFVITGTLSIPRDRMKEKIEESGGLIRNSLSSKTDFLLVGDNPGSKLARAKDLGVQIINEEELTALLSST